MTATLDTPVKTTSTRRPKRYVWMIALAVVLAAGSVLITSIYFPLDPAKSNVPTRNDLHFAFLVLHIFSGGLAMALGMLQFVPWLRKRHRVHRYIGRAYFYAGVFPSAVFGLVSAVLSTKGVTSAIPLSLLSLVWFYTGLQGLKAARQRKFAVHREWMIRNFALTTTAITSRLAAIPVVILFQPSDPAAMELFIHDLTVLLHWTPPVLHLIAAEWYIQRHKVVRA